MKTNKVTATFLLPLLLWGACHPARQAVRQEAQVHQALSGKRIGLPNGWSLTPVGRSLPLGDLPLQLVASPDGRLLAATNNGVSRQFIQLFDTGKEQEVANVTIDKSWYGLAFSPDGRRLYASGGNDNTIVVFRVEGQTISRASEIRLGAAWPRQKICPAGLAVDGAAGRLFAVTREDSSLYAIALEGQSGPQRLKLPSEPYTVVVNPALQELYVSLWGAKKIAVFDRTTLQRKSDLPAGDHPNEMVLNKKGTLLYVANSLDNSVSVIDLRAGKVLEVLDAALYPGAPNGSTTNSVALSADEKTLYIANADNNCLAVFDVSVPGESRSKGFIPTGWYPTSVRVVNGKIHVANGKGLSSFANPDGPQPTRKRQDGRAEQYIGALFKGTLSIIDPPDAGTLAAWTRLVYENSPYAKSRELHAEGEKGNPIPMRVGDPSPIRHVFYIIKENRTYDQVLGDLPEGNGDPSLCLFPDKVTPNQHALAREFVLLDNFYVDAEVSADGHNWSMAAYANDYVEKVWPTSYGGRGGNYEFEGTRRVAFPRNGFIWDYCKRAGVSYRTYGEFADENKANYETLEGHFCPNYSSWDLNYPDVNREADWRRDFDSLLAVGQVPRFNTIRFGNDHTSGMKKGAFSPQAAVADNDQAVGRFIEHLSHSPIWKSSAVFILEDDAQNGSDHVDAHRSIAFVVSPYTRRKFRDTTLYSTTSMVRTMELILGLPPMSQYDAGATPMWRCFTAVPDSTPFRARPAQVATDERNAAVNELSRQSESFNLARLDAVPERAFNEVLWKAVKGMDSTMPPPRRGAWVKVTRKDDDD